MATAGIREVKMSHAYAGLDGAAFCVMYKSKVADDRCVGCRTQPSSLAARGEPRSSALYTRRDRIEPTKYVFGWVSTKKRCSFFFRIDLSLRQGVSYIFEFGSDRTSSARNTAVVVFFSVTLHQDVFIVPFSMLSGPAYSHEPSLHSRVTK